MHTGFFIRNLSGCHFFLEIYIIRGRVTDVQRTRIQELLSADVANVMDDTGELERSSTSPCGGVHGVEWCASAAASSSSMFTVWKSLIFVLLSDFVYLVSATDAVQPAPRRVSGMFQFTYGLFTPPTRRYKAVK